MNQYIPYDLIGDDQEAETKENHKAVIVQIGKLEPHNNADNLAIVVIDGYQVVVRKDTFSKGDLAVYIQPDSIVPQTEPFKFIWEPYLDNSDLAGPDSLTPDKRRRITVKKLRGQWSEGLLMPVSDFPELYTGPHLTEPSTYCQYGIGSDVSGVLGIKHYDPDYMPVMVKGQSTNGPQVKRRLPKTIKGWFFFILHKLGLRRDPHNFSENVSFRVPTYDVKSLKNYPNSFTPDDEVIVTEKIHGSNARYLYLDGKMYAGSRNLWKTEDSKCKWRQALVDVPEITDFCKANPGSVLYGEIVPTQSGFTYGAEPNEVRFFPFDVRLPNGEWAEIDIFGAGMQTFGFVDVVPVLYRGKYDEATIKALTNGPSHVRGANNIREGVVIKKIPETRRRHGRAQLKLVSQEFLKKDSE